MMILGCAGRFHKPEEETVYSEYPVFWDRACEVNIPVSIMQGMRCDCM